MAEGGLTAGSAATGAVPGATPPGRAGGAPAAGAPAAAAQAPDSPAARDASVPTAPGAEPTPAEPTEPAWRAVWIGSGRCVEADPETDPPPAGGFTWIDARADLPQAWLPAAERITGVTVLDEHLSDAENPKHPSYFDSTRDYEMVVFRGLAMPPEVDLHQSIRIRTQPTVFFVFPRCLVTVRPADSRQVPVLRQRLLDATRAQRLPTSPEELMLRMLNGMVDRYLELREPLTRQLDDWQRDLLDPRVPFRDWVALLEARRQLRKLENLSEEQLDALQEWRDERLEHREDLDDAPALDPAAGGVPTRTRPPALPGLTDVLEVRVNDLVEHIERVRAHARRLEDSVESAVQLHFSATAHRTNQIMRTLTVLTATFMPLTLITGVFGMNFEFIPGIHSASGFWWTIGAMATIAAALVGFFRWRRYLEETGPREPGTVRRRRRAAARATPARGAARPERRRVRPAAARAAAQPRVASRTQSR